MSALGCSRLGFGNTLVGPVQTLNSSVYMAFSLPLHLAVLSDSLEPCLCLKAFGQQQFFNTTNFLLVCIFFFSPCIYISFFLILNVNFNYMFEALLTVCLTLLS